LCRSLKSLYVVVESALVQIQASVDVALINF
jgi:hypothetical protein